MTDGDVRENVFAADAGERNKLYGSTSSPSDNESPPNFIAGTLLPLAAIAVSTVATFFLFRDGSESFDDSPSDEMAKLDGEETTQNLHCTQCEAAQERLICLEREVAFLQGRLEIQENETAELMHKLRSRIDELWFRLPASGLTSSQQMTQNDAVKQVLNVENDENENPNEIASILTPPQEDLVSKQLQSAIVGVVTQWSEEAKRILHFLTLSAIESNASLNLHCSRIHSKRHSDIYHCGMHCSAIFAEHFPSAESIAELRKLLQYIGFAGNEGSMLLHIPEMPSKRTKLRNCINLLFAPPNGCNGTGAAPATQ